MWNNATINLDMATMQITRGSHLHHATNHTHVMHQQQVFIPHGVLATRATYPVQLLGPHHLHYTIPENSLVCLWEPHSHGKTNQDLLLQAILTSKEIMEILPIMYLKMNMI